MSEGHRQPIVWIIDDSPTERVISERSLGPRFDFVHFADGAEVIERLAAGGSQPDIMLLDWVMPGMTGDEVCRFIRAHETTRELPVILVTASRVETEDVVKGLSSGANDYVARPFAPEELRARVEAILRVKQLADAARRERARLDSINQLGRALFSAGNDIPKIIGELADALTTRMCDGCAVMLLPGQYPELTVVRHRADPSGEALTAIASLADPAVFEFPDDARALATLPPTYHPYLRRFGLRGFAILPFPSLAPIAGIVTVTRERGTEPFAAVDLDTITTCIEYASLAVQNALLAAERERVAAFQEQMLGIVSHDLRNPLGAITTGMSVIEMRAEELPGIKPIVARMRSSARRMTAMIDQLLDVTRARLGGGIPVSLRPTSLDQIARGVLDEISLARSAARIELVTDGEVAGIWDPDRLSQVVANLVTNAMQYGRPDHPIGVEVRAEPQAAVLKVSNANVDQPIDPDRLRVIFDPYARGKDTGRNTGGLGLGLYIVSEIVRSHGGTIKADSSLDGTVFTVVLPRPETARAPTGPIA